MESTLRAIYGPICKSANFFGGKKSLNVSNVKVLSKKKSSFWWFFDTFLSVFIELGFCANCGPFKNLNGLNDLNSLNSLSGLNDLYSLISSKTFNLK
jgi:hypothetical protein